MYWSTGTDQETDMEDTGDGTGREHRCDRKNENEEVKFLLCG